MYAPVPHHEFSTDTSDFGNDGIWFLGNLTSKQATKQPSMHHMMQTNNRVTQFENKQTTNKQTNKQQVHPI